MSHLQNSRSSLEQKFEVVPSTEIEMKDTKSSSHQSEETEEEQR